MNWIETVSKWQNLVQELQQQWAPKQLSQRHELQNWIPKFQEAESISDHNWQRKKYIKWGLKLWNQILLKSFPKYSAFLGLLFSNKRKSWENSLCICPLLHRSKHPQNSNIKIFWGGKSSEIEYTRKKNLVLNHNNDNTKHDSGFELR